MRCHWADICQAFSLLIFVSLSLRVYCKKRRLRLFFQNCVFSRLNTKARRQKETKKLFSYPKALQVYLHPLLWRGLGRLYIPSKLFFLFLSLQSLYLFPSLAERVSEGRERSGKVPKAIGAGGLGRLYIPSFGGAWGGFFKIFFSPLFPTPSPQHPFFQRF